MTTAEIKRQVETKIAELSMQALLLDEIQDACEEHGFWTLSGAIEKEQEELTALRRAVRMAYEKA